MLYEVITIYRELEKKFGSHVYARIDVPTTPEKKEVLSRLSSENISASELAGEKITAIQTSAPGNNVKIGGVKVISYNFV